jgi:hypothetical protein
MFFNSVNKNLTVSLDLDTHYQKRLDPDPGFMNMDPEP